MLCFLAEDQMRRWRWGRARSLFHFTKLRVTTRCGLMGSHRVPLSLKQQDSKWAVPPLPPVFLLTQAIQAACRSFSWKWRLDLLFTPVSTQPLCCIHTASDRVSCHKSFSMEASNRRPFLCHLHGGRDALRIKDMQRFKWWTNRVFVFSRLVMSPFNYCSVKNIFLLFASSSSCLSLLFSFTVTQTKNMQLA